MFTHIRAFVTVFMLLLHLVAKSMPETKTTLAFTSTSLPLRSWFWTRYSLYWSSDSSSRWLLCLSISLIPLSIVRSWGQVSNLYLFDLTASGNFISHSLLLSKLESIIVFEYITFRFFSKDAYSRGLPYPTEKGRVQSCRLSYLLMNFSELDRATVITRLKQEP